MSQQLERQVHSNLLLSNDKENVLAVAKNEKQPVNTKEIIIDLMLLDFLGLKRESSYYEKISRNGQTPSYIFTEHALSEPGLWDSKAQQVTKAHPNYKRLNNLLLKKLTEATDTTLEMEANKTDSSTRTIKKKIQPVDAGTFNDVAQAYLKEELALGHYNVYNADKPRIERFVDFTGNKIFHFQR